MIHPTAIVHSAAKVHATVQVGPYCVIDEGVQIGAGCSLGPNAYVTGLTIIAENNRFHAGCVIGDAPQDLKYDGRPTRLRIGEGNVFREHVTVHRSNKTEGETVIGSNSFLMQHSHVAHDCVIGNNVILAGGALLAGHAIVQDRAFISGNCLVHQFTRVGTLAIMQGGSAISKDLPPFCIALRENEICGLNVIGLRRAGYSAADRLQLKKAYHFLFRGGKNLRVALEDAAKEFASGPARDLVDFVRQAGRGVCADVGRANPGGDSET